jgi:hypothetical protein
MVAHQPEPRSGMQHYVCNTQAPATQRKQHTCSVRCGKDSWHCISLQSQRQRHVAHKRLVTAFVRTHILQLFQILSGEWFSGSSFKRHAPRNLSIKLPYNMLTNHHPANQIYKQAAQGVCQASLTSKSGQILSGESGMVDHQPETLPNYIHATQPLQHCAGPQTTSNTNNPHNTPVRNR